MGKEKWVPIEKRTKKAQKAAYSQRRLIPPRTAGAHKSPKDYDRSKEKVALRKQIRESDCFFIACSILLRNPA